MVPSGKFCAREHLRCTPRLWGTQNGAEQGPVLYVVTLLLWLTLVLRRRCPPAVVGLRRAGDVPGDATALAALSISGPTIRLTRNRIEELAPALVQHAHALSRRLGHQDDKRGAA